MSIPEGFAASAALYALCAAFVFVAVTIADQYGKRPTLYRRGITVTLVLGIVAGLLAQVAILAEALS